MGRFVCIMVLIFSFIAGGCFNNADQSLRSTNDSSTTPISDITSAHFSGALDAKNKVTGIQVRWPESTSEVSMYRVYRADGKRLNLLASLPETVTSFIDGDVIWGTVYKYLVKAVDKNGLEDSNARMVSALAWGGIGSVSSESRESIKITFDTSTPLADEIRIYLTSKSTNEKVLAAVTDGSSTEVTIENLKSGYVYYVSAQAYLSALRQEDGNEVKFEISTETEGYHSFGIEPPKWRNVTNIRAFGDSPNSPVHPDNPDKNPINRVVEIGFKPFLGSDPTTKYVVIRTALNIPIETSAVNGCTEMTLTSCKVCELTGNSNLFCRDTKVASAPAKYRYTLALVKTDSLTSETWVEPVPQDKLDQFTVMVPIPPDNMVLVHRSAANYEMCSTINQQPDPLNFNRCPYQGIGGVPYSTGHNKPPLNLPRGFYDFGYNLFVDRYPLACNWTKQAFGGKCGASGADGDCVGTASPSPTIGAEGNVYLKLDPPSMGSWGSFCFVKRAGEWRGYDYIVENHINNETYLRNMFTTNPKEQDGHRALAQVSIAPNTSNEVCKLYNHPSYGTKRIMRMREYRILTAMPTIPDEPNYMPYSRAHALRTQSTPHNSTNGYGCDVSFGEVIPNSISDMLAPTNEVAAFMLGGVRQGQGRYFLGSKLNVDCQSRYGVAHNFSQSHVTSDVVYYDPINRRYTGQISPIDNGNRDLLTDVNGGLTGFKIENLTNLAVDGSNTIFNLFAASNGNHTYVALPLGMPINLPSSSVYFLRNLYTEVYSHTFRVYPTAESSTSIQAKQVVVANRWDTNLRINYSGKEGGASIRCVLPAE